MASPGEMVRCVAQVLGIPEQTAVVHDRNLAEAGLRAKGGRGRSAAKMSPLDAANLLTALVGSSMVKDAVQSVEAYAALPANGGEIATAKDSHSVSIDGNPTGRWSLVGFPIPALQALPDNHTFRDALVALLTSSANGTLRDAIKTLPAREAGQFQIPAAWKIEVRIFGPLPQASVRIWTQASNEQHNYSPFTDDVEEILKVSAAYPGDLNQIRTFGETTILAIGDLLADRRPSASPS